MAVSDRRGPPTPGDEMKRRIVSYWSDTRLSEMYIERAGGVMRAYRLSVKNMRNLDRAWERQIVAQEEAAARRIWGR